jgi:hypothetical protein
MAESLTFRRLRPTGLVRVLACFAGNPASRLDGLRRTVTSLEPSKTVEMIA